MKSIMNQGIEIVEQTIVRVWREEEEGTGR